MDVKRCGPKLRLSNRPSSTRRTTCSRALGILGGEPDEVALSQLIEETRIEHDILKDKVSSAHESIYC